MGAGMRRLAKELCAMGHKISRTVVGELLNAQKFSLQGNRKTLEGGQSPDREAQFHHINTSVTKALAANQSVISVDTKKKELVGDFKNHGKEWRPQGSPEPVRVHDFIIPQLGRAVPYGVYDRAANAGWVSVGVSADTAAFAVNWRGKPLVSYQAIISFIGATTTENGLTVSCEHDEAIYHTSRPNL